MKTAATRLLLLISVSALLTSFACADETNHAKILKERDAVLSQILAAREARLSTGIGDDEAVLSARLALYTFRRDSASSQSEKHKQQELIVALWQKKLAGLKSRMATGLIGQDDVLLATDSLLQAQQLLEELTWGDKTH